jgi:hypothetical protein
MGRTCFTGPRPPEDGRQRQWEPSDGGDDEGGTVHRICGSGSLAAFLDHNGEELHFLGNNLGRQLRWILLLQSVRLTYFEFGVLPWR